jgi:hypothetical protein
VCKSCYNLPVKTKVVSTVPASLVLTKLLQCLQLC